MTARYTFTGFTVSYNDSGDEISVASDTQMSLIAPTSGAFIRYEVNTFFDGFDDVEEFLATGNFDLSSLRVNGVLSGLLNNAPLFGVVAWGDNNLTYFMALDGDTETHVFRLGGAALPTFETLTQYHAFDEQVISSGLINSGPFSDNQDILLASLPNVQIVEVDDLLPINGSLGDDQLNGTAGADLIKAFGGEDTINGLGSDDTLDGGAGADLLIGGQGSNRIIVENVGDRVSESRNWAGHDTVESSVDFRMGRKHIEDLELTGDARIGASNGLQNWITGNDGDNILDGGKNNDTLVGGAGNDTYLLRAPGDTIIEVTDSGIDVAKSNGSFALMAHVENLFMQTVFLRNGTPVNFNGIGNGLASTIIGTPFENTLVGREGSDTLKVSDGGGYFCVRSCNCC
jgi:Ca2+-binding RTX toxin-like protein